MESPASPCPTLPLSSCPQERLRSKVQDKSPDSPQGLASSLSPSPWDPVLARHTLPPPHNDCSVWPTPQNKNEIFSNFRGNEENSDSPRPASPFTSPRAVYQSDNRGPQARRFAYSSIQHTPEHSSGLGLEGLRHYFRPEQACSSGPSSHQHDVQYLYPLKIFLLQVTENPAQQLRQRGCTTHTTGSRGGLGSFRHSLLQSLD